MSLVSRHYIDVEGRAVHYRVAGRGPLVLLLHQSPQSSADLLDLMDRWADRFTMLAPDRPGCGNSDVLPLAAPSFEDYARALAAFMDAVGVERVPVYGFHTGATEAIALADLFPERVAAVAANGVVALTAEELADIEANYLPPFVPSWDGAHLAWLWARMREQTIFFPWHRRSAATRMRYDVPSPERLQRNALELLRRSDVYHLAYRAAFRYDAVAALRRLRMPVLITAANWDPLSRYLDRLGPAAGGRRLHGSRTPADAEVLAADFLAPLATVPPPLPLPAGSGASGRRHRRGAPRARAARYRVRRR
jgi:pimeloyl-ACP methyl ester carboxylesterase